MSHEKPDYEAAAKAGVKRIAELEAALEKIANCEKVCDGDVVDVARKALGR